MLPNVELPICDGSNPHDWLVKMEHFLVTGQFRDEAKMDVIALFVEGRIKQWFVWVLRRGGFQNWQDLKQQFVVRFPESIDEKPSSIKQSGSVLDSMVENAELSSPIAGLTDSPLDKLFYNDFFHEMNEETEVAQLEKSVEFSMPKRVEQFEKFIDRVSVTDTHALGATIAEVQPEKVKFQLRFGKSPVQLKEVVSSGISLEDGKRGEFNKVDQDLGKSSHEFSVNVLDVPK